MLTLHVWGPGFGLPSIDPHCLSAIAYLQLAVPRGEWQIIPSSNPHLSPSKTLPALQHSTVWSTGLPQILDYITQLYPSLAPDSLFCARERAQITAFTAYVQSRGGEVVDLSLYADEKNFTAVTRPGFASLLGWPECYYYPTVERRRARGRTAHLGVGLGGAGDGEGAGGMEVLGETPGERAVRAARAGGGAGGVEGEVGRTKREVQLSRVCADFLSPLARMVADSPGPFWFGAAPSSLDCWVLGYLALLLIPDMPQDWAKSAVQREPRLAAYVHDMRARLLEGVVLGRAERGDLPWLGGVLVDEVRGWVGGLWTRGDEEWRDDDPMLEERKRRAVLARRREWWKSLGFVLGGVAGMMGYVVWSGIVAIGGSGAEEGEEVVVEVEQEDGE
ncbi:outer mitochondrial membrane transport complex protein-domain-containing protein [Tricharina praecox]|uniref:outer mitochondrial membrane transport complex protein-domain-containing protein n=1 Tax=Tricharina praecox TaxID=43433 RepID=UPI00221ED0AC|nr:outer mitochondrial membrane transport complex protein-domain-containing protein [Tricharina praecox]KAI5846679.1 outer mitochondrial membrane transport complex protein-domain-containing protein [Tricharina praecox]